MSKVVADLIKSKAIVWYAPLTAGVAEALPDVSTVGYGEAWAGGWLELGFTNAPLKSFYEDTRHNTSIEEQLSPIKQWRTEESAKFETVIATYNTDVFGLMTDQTTVETASGPAQKGFDQLDVGGQAIVAQYSIGFEALRIDSAGVNQPIRVVFPYATFQQNGETEFSQKTDGYVDTPVSIMAFGDPANDGNLLIRQVITLGFTA